MPYLDRPAQTYLFGNSNGDPLRQNVFYEYRWQQAVALARSRGLLKRPRFHDLRHTHVAWLIAGGTPLPKIQARLGHESIQTTIDVYGGLLAATDDQLDAVVSAAFTPVAAPACPGPRPGSDRGRARQAGSGDARQPALF